MAKTHADEIKEAYGEGSAARVSDGVSALPEVFFPVLEASGPYADLYDERLEDGPDEDLIQNIVESGQRYPILVWKDGERDGKPNYVIVDGLQRWLALTEINKRKLLPEAKLIDAKILRAKTLNECILIKIESNMQRKNETPRTLALKVMRALKHWPPSRVRLSTKLNQASFDGLVLYVELSPEAQKAVDSRTLALASIPEIAKVPRHEQQAALDILIANGAKTTTDVANTLQDVRAGKPPRKPADRQRLPARKTYTKMLDALTNAPNSNDVLCAYATIRTLFGYADDIKAFPEVGEVLLPILKPEKYKALADAKDEVEGKKPKAPKAPKESKAKVKKPKVKKR